MRGPRIHILLIALLQADAARVLAQDVSVMMKEHDEWISRYQQLEFTVSRALSADEHIALVVGTTDVTGLCTFRNDTLSYVPEAVPLPAGPVDIAVYHVDAAGTWTQAGTYTVNVLTAAGFEKSVIIPSLSIANKGQLAENHVPDAGNGGRKKFQELNGQLAMKLDVERSGVSVGMGLTLVGVSFRQEALRFAEKQDRAAKIDLSSYLFETRTGSTALSVGHISHGRQRHLLNGFSSRGMSVSTAIASFADVSGAVLNGTSIVGWDNFAGLNNPNHRVYSGALGLEILPSVPGTIRVEGSYVHGSQLPLSNFNEGQITDAEKSEGGGVRLQLSDPEHIITLDAGFAKVRFTNPPDPLLSQEFDIVPVQATTRQARYADVSWEVLRNETLFVALPARLNVAFRHERVDPLYRAVGVSARADLLQNTYEIHSGIGPVQMDVVHLQSEDNLAAIPSVLKSKTRQTGANVAFSPASIQGSLQRWLPTLSYALNTTHQFGVSTPTNSDFTPDRVPDQVTTSHTAAIEWQGTPVRAGYRGAFTVQDNRQAGRETADAVNRTHGVTISLTPLSQLAMSFEGSLESAENVETGSVIRSKRFGASITAQLFPGANTSMNGSLSTSKPDDGSSKQKQAAFSLETSYSFDLTSFSSFNWRGQLFVRYSWNELSFRDPSSDLDTRSRAWAVQSGVTFNIF